MPFAASLLAQTKKVPVGLELYSVRGELRRTRKPQSLPSPRWDTRSSSSTHRTCTGRSTRPRTTASSSTTLGIKCLSTHNGAQALSAENLSKTVELNQIIGSKAIIVASAPGKIADVDGWKAFAATLAAAADKLRPQGMSTGFHNHQIEWRPVATRGRWTCSQRERRKTWSCSSTAARRRSRRRSVAWIKANPGRIKSLHLKDWGKGESRGYAVAFGEGDVQWKPLLAAAETVGGAEYHSSNRSTPAPRRARDGETVPR